MAKEQFKGVLVGGLAATVVVISASAFAGRGIGAFFNLGSTNTVNARTTLTGTTAGKNLLQITNRGSGSALGLAVRAGKAPLVVSPGAGKAVNLSADYLDGVDSTGFLRSTPVMLSQQRGWLQQFGGAGSVDTYANLQQLTGSGTYYLPLTTPNVIGAQAYHLAGVEVCYNMNAAGQMISGTEVFRSSVDNYVEQTFTDATDRTSVFPTSECYTVSVNDATAPVASVYTLKLAVTGTARIVRVTTTFDAN